MQYSYFSNTGSLLPIEQAIIPLDNIEYAYGYGVYETLRVVHGNPYFIKQHCARLLASAGVIALEHPFSSQLIETSIRELITKNSAETCNVKVMLLGGPTPSAARFYIQCLSPLFPDRKLYSSGAHFITYKYQRDFPGAKTLNMLPSYLAYRQAKQSGAYDALLMNDQGNITEGTRTNFLCIKEETIISPPEEQILPGIMRAAVLDFAQKHGFKLKYQTISLNDLGLYDGAFVTSTSSKILPVRSIDSHIFGPIPTKLAVLIKQFSSYLDQDANIGKTRT